MNTYDTVKKISTERFADSKGYWSVEQELPSKFLSLAKYLPELNGGVEFYSENLSERRYEEKLASHMGVRAMRLITVSFGYFDGRDTMCAVPMYASSEKRNERTVAGSRHHGIVSDYWDEMRRLGVRKGFVPAGGEDVFGGECIIMEGRERPISHFNVFNKDDLSEEKSLAFEQMTQEFPDSTYLITCGARVYACFDHD